MIQRVVLVFCAMALAGCEPTGSAPLSQQTRDEAFAECLDLGFAADAPEMEKCINADSRAQRRVLIDMDTYGTF